MGGADPGQLEANPEEHCTVRLAHPAPQVALQVDQGPVTQAHPLESTHCWVLGGIKSMGQSSVFPLAQRTLRS